MDPVYLLIVWALFIFAFFDLIVGVSNDAVNFLNSALWSKAGSRKLIFAIASAWILVWALFSSWMMEVARKWIFHPEFFSFSEIMLIFLAVMITDVILLDLYNTLKLPTSTTVSIVFELLGAAVAISLIKIYFAWESIVVLRDYINSSKALEIISGILLSVVFAFLAWALIQYLVRLVFTFEYTKKLKYYGALWWGASITAITYFLLIKWAKGSSLLTGDQLARITSHTRTIVIAMFVWWTILLQVFSMVKKINIPKIVVLVWTFALAMAFAWNDLVNFIWVPIAGFSSYMIYAAQGWVDPSLFMMDGLAGKVPTPFYFLLMAWVIMIITLWYSSKARAVTETEIWLWRDSVGYERFEASYISRMLVGWAIHTKWFFGRFIPTPWIHAIQQRFNKPVVWYKKDAPAFDLIRASVNLTVASILIAIATSMKLPLSTTYVTFMVAMWASLADGVRWRESAVYRITWVLTVIGWWFMTALSAFIAAALIATLVYFSDIMIVWWLVIAVFARMYFTHAYHKKQSAKDEKVSELYNYVDTNLDAKAEHATYEVMTQASSICSSILKHVGIAYEKWLNQSLEKAKDLHYYTKVLKNTIHETFAYLPKDSIEFGHYYIKVVVYLRKISHSILNIVESSRTYVVNHHPPLTKDQVEELEELDDKVSNFIRDVLSVISSKDHTTLDKIYADHEELLALVDVMKRRQLERIKWWKTWVRNSSLYLTLLVELQNLLIFHTKLLKSFMKLLWHLDT